MEIKEGEVKTSILRTLQLKFAVEFGPLISVRHFISELLPLPLILNLNLDKNEKMKKCYNRIIYFV